MTALDKDAIKAALESSVEDLVQYLLPAGHRDGRQWAVGDIDGNAGQSLRVELAGPKVGQWFDHQADDGGDVLELIGATQKISEFPDVLLWGAEWLGDSPPPPISNGQDREAEADAEAAQRRDAAVVIWRATAPAGESLAEVYLRGRAITIPLPPAIRYAANLRYAPSGIDLPALVAGVQDIGGDCIAVVRIYLALDGQGKAGVSNPKRTLGSIKGGAVRLAPVAETLIVTEGIENGLSVMQATGIGAWAGLGSNIRNVVLPPETTTVIIAADNDENEAGKGHAEHLAARLHSEGRTVRIAYPPTVGEDWNDLLQQGREDEIRALIENAPAWTPPEPEPSPSDTGHDADSGVDGNTPKGQAKELEAEAKRLAGLPLSQRAIERKAVAKRFGVPAHVLDVLVKGFIPVQDDGRGDEMVFDDIEPWHETVDGAALLNEIGARIHSYVVMSDHAIDAVSLWCAHAHALDAAYVSPRLQLKSAEKRSGKTTLLHVQRRLVPRPLPVSSISGAGIFRTVHAYQPTLLIDEADRFMRDNEEITGIINSSHTRGDFAVRMIGQGTDMKAVRFSTWCAMAIAGIGRQADTIEDRSVIIPMARKMPFERVKKFRVDRTDEFTPLARKLARWTADNMQELAEADPDVPDELHDRAADNWRPLIAIADAVGGDWPERARAAAKALSGSEATGDDSLRVMLLQDIQEIFAESSESVFASADMVVKLNALEHRPWPEFKRGKPITTRQLASLLAPFGIAPKVIWHHGGNIRGYEKPQFMDAFSRYGGDRSVRSLGMAENSQSLRIEKRSEQPPPNGSKSGSNPQNSADPYERTDRSTPGGGNSEISPDSEPPGYAPEADDIERDAITSEAEFDDTATPSRWEF